MDYTSVNFIAILVCGIMAMIVGGLWYSPILFGKQWIAMSGVSQAKLEEGKNKMFVSYVINFVASLIMFYVLAHFVQLAKAVSWTEGVTTGFWLWLGLVAPTSLGSVLWEQKPWLLWVLNNSYYLLMLMAAGAILAVWF